MAAPRFVGEKRSSKHRCDFFTFTRSLLNSPRRVKFKLSIASIRIVCGKASIHHHASSRQRMGEWLLRVAFQLVAQMEFACPPAKVIVV